MLPHLRNKSNKRRVPVEWKDELVCRFAKRRFCDPGSQVVNNKIKVFFFLGLAAATVPVLVASGRLVGVENLSLWQLVTAIALEITIGALIGFSGAILTKIMCDAMNRDIMNVLFGGMKIPDWHNATTVYRALVAQGLGPDQFPLFHAVYEISYGGAHPREILAAIEASPQLSCTPRA